MAQKHAALLTVDELQGYLKIPKPTLYALAQGGKIPAAKIGKHWRFRRRDIDRWLQAQVDETSARRQRRIGPSGDS